MLEQVPIRSISFSPADTTLRSTGLLGFVSLRYGGLELDGIALRHTRDGRHILSFPETRRRGGHLQQPVRPASGDARAAIESAVFSELRARGVLS